MIRQRRQFLQHTALAAGSMLLPACGKRSPTNARSKSPFTLGVASGYPTATSVVIWTRLAPEPLSPDGGMPPVPVDVEWQVAADASFRRPIAAGKVAAKPESAHAVRVEIRGLNPEQPYWYRFRFGDADSRIGRTRTLPPAGSPLASLRLGAACCQYIANGEYAAYAAMAADDLDLILHLGDYIYEYPASARDGSGTLPEATTLDDYRRHYALYKLDPLLQRAHASTPWMVIWDDHEVANNYAGDFSERADPEVFRARREAAYQAWYEHLPVPPRMQAHTGEQRIYTAQLIGDLASVFMLDGRRYRSRQSCGPGIVETCPDMTVPERTMLGTTQEQWLTDSLGSSRARWNLLAQQTVFASIDQRAGPEIGYWSDGWSGYPAARARLVDFFDQGRIANPVILSGDLHAFLVNDVQRPDGDGTVVATEFVTTSISSGGPSQRSLDTWRDENPNVRFANAEHRGYTRLTLTPDRLDAELIAVDDVTDPESGTHRLASWHVLDGQPGAVS